MNKKKIACITLLNIFLMNSTVFAEPITDSDKAKLNERAATYQSITDEVSELEDKVRALDNDISILLGEIDKLNSEIEATDKEYQEADEKYQELLARFNSRLRSIYKSGSLDYVQIIVNADNLGDLLNNMAMIKKISKIDKDFINEITEVKEELEKTKVTLDELKKENQEKLDEVEGKKAELQVSLDELKEKQSNSKQDLMEVERGIVQAPISIINSSGSVSDIRQAIETLTNLRNHIVTDTVDNEVANAISKGKDKIEQLQYTSNAPNRGNSATPPASSNAVVLYAYNFLGTPYVWGGSTPSGFDCSGFTSYVYRNFGIGIGRTTYDQVKAGRSVSLGSLQPGDLLFWGDPSAPWHVGIYIGGNQYIHSPQTGDVVKVSSGLGGVTVARRVL